MLAIIGGSGLDPTGQPDVIRRGDAHALRRAFGPLTSAASASGGLSGPSRLWPYDSAPSGELPANLWALEAGGR